jgi:hypothetical protein
VEAVDLRVQGRPRGGRRKWNGLDSPMSRWSVPLDEDLHASVKVTCSPKRTSPQEG